MTIASNAKYPGKNLGSAMLCVDNNIGACRSDLRVVKKYYTSIFN
jgi:hypothetical protein